VACGVVSFGEWKIDSTIVRDKYITYQYYDEAHDAFMALPPYTGAREGMGSI
jgi:hypothetical protein